MQKKYQIIIIAGVIIAACACWGLYLYNLPHRNVSGVHASVQMDAVGMCAEYKRDEVVADKRFVGKVVEVMGVVMESHLTGNRANIRLGTSGSDMAVNCDFLVTDAGEFHIPPNGAKMTVKGRCTGFLQDVNLVDCVIE